ncbi:MAG TPA: FAD:protein FMN transferase [Solirubrobacteraceae bacterium]|nr:FAD:protein FMN transferase [Solirubrobacteraceae bacterium]
MPREVRDIMGMPIAIEVRGGDVDVEPAFAWLRWVDRTFSTYDDSSEISRLGRGEIALADCSPEVDEVLTRCAALREETGGYFSVRAGGSLDPCGLVKGWAVGRAAALLEQAGAECFAVDAAGDVVVRGRPGDDGPWRVGVRHPQQRAKVAAVLGCEDVAVATSGAYERGEHVLDPHTGRPPSGLLSVTILGPDIATADAYATAAFAMGADARFWVAGLQGYEAMLITSGREVLSTPGLDRYRIS